MPGTKHTAQSIHDQIRGIDFLSFGAGLFDKDKFKPITADKVSLNKPRSGGFWACPVWTDDPEVPPRERGYAWIDFLFTEMSGSHKPEIDSGGCRFKLSPDARVLVIDSREDLPRKYIHYKEESIDKNVIDFVAISQDYDAFLLTENGAAEFRKRTHKNEVELPDWDFESLLIFNPEVITDVRPLTQADNDILKDYLLSTYRTLSGEETLLSVDDYDYVHSPEFKRFFGDWENDPEHASVILNERGEPLPLYHGSNRLFDRFDFSKLASNTGKTTWTQKDTGATIEGDSTRAVFFSSSLTQAVSYSLLAQYYVFKEKHSALSDLWPVFDHGKNMFIRDRKQFVSLMETVADDVPELVSIIQEMNREPGKSFLKDILPAMDAGTRKAITDAISEKRDALKESVSAMDRGGLSNSYSSTIRQQKVIRTLEENVFSLMRNDLSVPNEFGTFEQYDCGIIGGSGNAEIWITTDENKRIRFQEKGNPAVYFDEANFDWIYNYFIPRIRACNKELLEKVNGEIERLGYNVNAHIYKCFLKSSRPLEKDYEGSSYMDIYKGDENTPTAYIAALQVQEALDKGNDAVVYRNITDPFTSDSYGVFHDSQVLIASRADKIELDNDIFMEVLDPLSHNLSQEHKTGQSKNNHFKYKDMDDYQYEESQRIASELQKTVGDIELSDGESLTIPEGVTTVGDIDLDRGASLTLPESLTRISGSLTLETGCTLIFPDGFVLKNEGNGTKSYEANQINELLLEHSSKNSNRKMVNNDKNIISDFREKNFFLSNFATCKVVYEGVEYPSVENAFQAAKCKNVEDRKQFTSISAYQAKQMGRKVDLREDWDSVKDEIMRELVNYKFNNNPDMRDKLLSTGNAALVEGNSWGDTYWGVDLRTREGENKLGRILEDVRRDLIERKTQSKSNSSKNTSEIYVSYYGSVSIPENAFRVQISTSAPNNFVVDHDFKLLHPNYQSMVKPHKDGIIDNNGYTERYNREVLERHKDDILKEMQAIVAKADGRPVVLLCYEKPGDFCHRYLVNNFLMENNIACQELPADREKYQIGQVPLVNEKADTKAMETEQKNLVFTESAGGYPQRTKENAQSQDIDITIAIAADMSTRGERATAKAAGLRYIGIETRDFSLANAKKVAGEIYEKLSPDFQNGKPLGVNFAGNGAYTLVKFGVSQEMADVFVSAVVAELMGRGVKFRRIISGGQTGIDEAGITAALVHGIPAVCHAPKGFLMRITDGDHYQDVLGRERFENRFKEKSLNAIKTMATTPQTDNAAIEQVSTSMETVKHYTGDIAPADDIVFVFGSNPEGRHGLGAAKIARQKFGAIYGQGEGLQGNSYAIPTKDLRVKENNSYRSISPEAITESIVRMYECAREHPDKKFMVAYRNTDKPSLNGYTGLEMIQMFTKAGAIPENVYFSEEWAKTGLLGKIPEEQQEQAPDQRNPLITELADKISKGLEKLPKKELIFDGPLYYGKEKASGYKVFLKGVAIQNGKLVGLRTSKYPGDRRFVVPMDAENLGDAYFANALPITDINPEILLRATLKRVNEDVKIRASKTLFILPAENNLFHETVKNILTKTGTPFIVAPQGSIFKADFKGMVEGIEKGQSVEGMNISTEAKIYGVDLVELNPSEPMPKNFVSISDGEIDHLIDTSALSKILEITGYTPATDTEQRYLNMVSANNIGGVAGLQDAGASKDVIEYIRQQDRTLKGETLETRNRAKIALENRVELEGGDWAVVKVSNFLNDFTIIEDALYEKHNLVIFNDNQLLFRSGESADSNLPQFTRLDQDERTLAELLEGILPKETDVEKLLASFESYKAEIPANLSALDIYRLMKESVFPPEGVEADLDATVERINTALAPDWAKDKNENEIKAYLLGVFRDLPDRGQQFLLSQTGLLQNNKALFYESHYDVYTTGFANKDLNTFMNTLPPDVEIVIDTRPRAYSINTPHFNKNSSNPDAVTFPMVLKEQGIEYIHIPETNEEFLPKLIEVINQHKGKVVIAGKENLASRSMRGQSLGPALERSGISVGHINQRYDKEKNIWLPTYSIQSQEETTKLLLRNYGVEIAEGSYKGVSFKEDKYFAEGVTLRKITHVERSDDRFIRGKWNYGQTVLTSQSDEPGLRAAVRDIAKQSNIVFVFTSNEKSAVANMTASAIKEAGADYVVVKIPKDKDELNNPEYAAMQFEKLKDKIYRHLVSFDSNVTVGIIGDHMSKIKYRQAYAKVTEEELQQGSKALFFSEMGGYEAGNSIISIDSEIEQEDITAFITNFMKAFNAKQEANEFVEEMKEPLFKATEIVALGETGAGIAGAIASQQLHINARLHLLKDGEYHVDDGTLNGRVIKDAASISNYLHQGYQASLSQDELTLQIDNVRNAGENISGPGLKDRHILTFEELGFSNSDILTLAEQARVNGIYIHEREVITEGGLKLRTAAPDLLKLIEMCEEGNGVGRTIDTDNMFNVDHILQAEINVAKMLNNDRRNGIGTITIANPYYPAQLQAFAGYTDNKNEVDMIQYEGGVSMVWKTVEERQERPAILRFKGNIEALSAPAVSLISNTESEDFSKDAAKAIGHELGKAGVTIATSLLPTKNLSHETNIEQSQSSVNNIQLIINAGEFRKTPGLKDRHILTLQNLGFSDVDILMMEDFSRTEGITLRTKEATEENDNGKEEKYLSSSTDLLAFINKCEESLGIVPLQKITEESILRAERNATKLVDGEKLRGVGIITIANPYYEKMLENSNLLEKDGAQEASGMKQPILRYRPKTEEMTIVLNAVKKPVKKLVGRRDGATVARDAGIQAGAKSILISPNGLNYENDQDEIEKTIASGGIVLSLVPFNNGESGEKMYKIASSLNCAFGSSVILLDGESLEEDEMKPLSAAGGEVYVVDYKANDPSIEGNNELLEMGAGSVKPDGSDLEGIIRHFLLSSVEDILEKDGDKPESISNKEESKKEVQVDSYKLTVVRCNDKQVFIVPETHKAVREALRKAYGEDIEFSENIALAKRNISGSVFKIDGENVRVPANDSAPVFTENTVYTLPLWYKDGQIYSIYNAPIRARGELEPLNRRMRNKEAVDKFIAAAKEVRGDMMEKLGLPRGADIRFANAMHLVITQTSAEVYMGHSLIAGIRLSNSGSLTLINKAPYNRDFKESDMEYLFHDDASDRKAEEERYHYSLFFDNAEAVENINSKVAAIRDEAIDKLIEKMREKIVGINGADAENLEFADADLTQAVKEGIIAEPSAEKKEEFDRAVAYACLQQEEAKHAKSIKALKKDAKALTSEIADKTAERDKAVSDAMAPEIIARTEETLNEKIESRQTIENKIDRLRSQIAILQVQKEKLIFAEKVLKSSSVQEGKLEKINLSVDGLMLSVAPGALSKKVDLDAVRQEMSSIKDKREEQVRAFTESIDKIENQSIQIINITKSYDEHQGTSAVGVARKEEIVPDSLSNGRYIIERDGKQAYADEQLNIRSDFFDSVKKWRGDKGVVCKDGKYNYVGVSGELIVSVWFDTISRQSEGLSIVTIDDSYGLVGESGELVGGRTFANVRPCSDGWAVVQGGFEDGENLGKFNYINADGKFMKRKWLDQASDFQNGIATVVVNGVQKIIDKKGVAVKPEDGDNRKTKKNSQGQH